MKYIKSLDGLRAFAVFFVIISHWLSDNQFIHQIPFGEIGVDIFFVLSGFLITSILLTNKIQQSENDAISKGSVIRNFVIRRTLRIFPIYYVTIFFLYLVATKTGTQIRSDFLYYLTYTSNINFYIRNQWDGIISHLWSLAVEEQFYLFWPWVIIYVNKKYLVHVMLIFVLVSIISNIVFNGRFSSILTTSCLDAFTFGGLLAYDKVYGYNISDKYRSLLTAIGIALILLFMYTPNFIPIRTVVALNGVWLINFLINEKKNILSSLFSHPFLVFIGKISYGIYLYHNIVPWLWENILNKLSSRGLPSFLFDKKILLVEEFCILILVSWLSWIILEKPINNLKKYFNYNVESKSNTCFIN